MGNDESKVVLELNEDDKTCLTFWQKFTYSLGQTAVSLSPALISSWLIYYYIGRTDEMHNGLLLVSAIAMSFGGLVPRFLEAIAEPLVGYWSDKFNFKMGRRIPWIVFGTPLLVLTSILIWWPPDAPTIIPAPKVQAAVHDQATADPSANLEHAASTGAVESSEPVIPPEAKPPGKVLFHLFSLEITPNFLWLLVIHTVFWCKYTAVVAPYLSLLPEITPYNNERINTSMFMAYNDVAGSVLGSAGLGVLIGAFAGGITIFGWRLDNAYKVCGLLIGILFTVCFYVSVSMIRETPYHEAKAVRFKFIQAFTETFRNPTFTPYVIASAAIRMSTDIILAGMPFMVTRIMLLSEEYAGYLQGVIILGAAFFFPLVSSKAIKHGKKSVYLFGMLLFTIALILLTMMKHLPILGWPIAAIASLFGFHMSAQWVSFAHCIGCLAICALPVAIIFVMQRPILNDVMDYDEKLTGYRREAMYNGMEGLISKPASGIAYFIVPLLLKYLGDTPDHPWGVLSTPITAAVLMFVGWVGFKFYQIEK